MLSKEEEARVRALVNRFLSPVYDRESIAADIIIRAWRKGHTYVSRGLIRKKCSTAYRKREREQKGFTEMIMTQQSRHNPELIEEQDQAIQQRGELVSRLMLSLTPIERKVLYAKFWEDQSLEQIAESYAMPRPQIQKLIRVALYRMGQEMIDG